jgi:type III secretion system YscD/HrpQ family protein
MKLEPSLETLQARIELRVLFGPQAGSRLQVTPGNYELGEGDECEVILSGPKMLGRHAKLSFDGEQLTITPLDGKVCDAQGNEVTESFPLGLGMPVEMGGIWISVDDVDAEWPDPTDVVSIMPPTAAPAAATTIAEDSSGIKSDSADKTPRRRAKAALITSITALTVMGIAGITLAAWLVNHPSEQAKTLDVAPKVALPDPPNLHKVRQILGTTAAGSSVEVIITRDRRLLIKGFVPDQASKTALTTVLETLTPPPQIELQVDADLSAAAATLLAERIDPTSAKLKVESVSGGVLTIEGAVLTQRARDAVMDMLQTTLPGLKRVNASIVMAEDLPQLLQDQLAASGLLKKIQIIDRQPEFILRGALTDDDMRRWENLIVNFTDRYGKLLPVKAVFKLATRKPPVNVQAIVGGTTPFVITENGDRITRGGDVNGNTLMIVKDTEIIFEGSERFRISR